MGCRLREEEKGESLWQHISLGIAGEEEEGTSCNGQQQEEEEKKRPVAKAAWKLLIELCFLALIAKLYPN